MSGKNGGKKSKEQSKDQLRTVFDINIKVFSNGKISINAPKDLAVFHEIITQAERIMIETYGPKKTEGKIVELHPKIELVRK